MNANALGLRGRARIHSVDRRTGERTVGPWNNNTITMAGRKHWLDLGAGLSANHMAGSNLRCRIKTSTPTTVVSSAPSVAYEHYGDGIVSWFFEDTSNASYTPHSMEVFLIAPAIEFAALQFTVFPGPKRPWMTWYFEYQLLLQGTPLGPDMDPWPSEAGLELWQKLVTGEASNHFGEGNIILTVWGDVNRTVDHGDADLISVGVRLPTIEEQNMLSYPNNEWFYEAVFRKTVPSGQTWARIDLTNTGGSSNVLFSGAETNPSNPPAPHYQTPGVGFVDYKYHLFLRHGGEYVTGGVLVQQNGSAIPAG
jgi:hypothetical protein